MKYCFYIMSDLCQTCLYQWNDRNLPDSKDYLPSEGTFYTAMVNKQNV